MASITRKPNLRERVGSSTATVLDTILFMGFLVIGIAAEIAVHLLTSNPLFVMAAPVSVLIAYVVLTFAFRRLRLRLDQVGDNCYYLGFLFTLTALSIALYEFHSGAIDIGLIVSNFGIALSSTIVGVALRVCLTQMREDPAEVEEQSRLQLAQASSRVKDELHATVRDMNAFRGILQQTITESFEEVNEKSSEAFIAAANRLAGAAEDISAEIAAKNEAFAKQFTQFNELTSRSVQSLEALVGGLESIRPPNEVFDATIGETVTSLRKLHDEMKRIADAAEQGRASTEQVLTNHNELFAKLSATVATLAANDGPLFTAIGKLGDATQNLGNLSNALSTSAHSMEESAAKHSAAIGRHHAALDESSQLLERHNQSLSKSLEENRAVLNEVEKNLTDMARALVRALD